MKKAYKVFNADWSCRSYTFKNEKGDVIGTVHEIDKDPKLCKVGFHYCKRLVDCFNYYTFDPINKVTEIEILGKIDTNDGDKECTNKFKIIRELSWLEVLKSCNTGDRNTGFRNTGDRNTGDRNTGFRNTGFRNTGNWNTGDWNTGNRNAGDRNTGNWNAGNCNTGNWNTGNWNAGSFNTKTPEKISIFNKECGILEWANSYKPNFLFFTLTEWINEDSMSQEEKDKNPNFHYLGGYLKKYGYKEAFKKSWDRADPKDRIKVKNLPNFNKEIFYQISGIDVDKN